MNGYNVNADLAKNLEVYARFIEARSSVSTPEKLDLPMVWGMYLDPTRPVGEPARIERALLEAQAPGPVGIEAGASSSPPVGLDVWAPENRVPEPLAAVVQEAAGPAEPLSFEGAMQEEGEEAVFSVSYRTPVSGDLDLLGLVNDRLKIQARRYPHPLSNEMDVFG